MLLISSNLEFCFKIFAEQFMILIRNISYLYVQLIKIIDHQNDIILYANIFVRTG